MTVDMASRWHTAQIVSMDICSEGEGGLYRALFMTHFNTILQRCYTWKGWAISRTKQQILIGAQDRKNTKLRMISIIFVLFLLASFLPILAVLTMLPMNSLAEKTLQTLVQMIPTTRHGMRCWMVKQVKVQARWSDSSDQSQQSIT